MPNYEPSPASSFNNLNVIVNDIQGVAINFFVNRNPLFSRLARSPLGSNSFYVTNWNYRATKETLGAAITDTTGTSVTVSDGSQFMIGDVFEVDTEAFLVTADPAGNVLTVAARGYGGTTAATHTNGTAVYLIGNSRTGSETNVSGVNRIPTVAQQWAQTFQHPYGVGGSLAAKTNYALPPGVLSVVGQEKMLAMQDCTDDFERSAYYGLGVSIAATTSRPAQKGLRSLCVTNNTLSPTNSGAYKPSDLIRDTIQPCFSAGGKPDIMIVSTDFMAGLSVWGQAVQRNPAGENAFGTPIDLFEVPFLTGINIIPAPLLRTGTVICLSSEEISIRECRAMFDKPKGSRGDAIEGDVIMEAAIQLNNEAHHAFVSGITAYSAT